MAKMKKIDWMTVADDLKALSKCPITKSNVKDFLRRVNEVSAKYPKWNLYSTVVGCMLTTATSDNGKTVLVLRNDQPFSQTVKFAKSLLDGFRQVAVQAAEYAEI